MNYLFLVNIGPVQGFIASARRTRDLSFGSWLLSELAKAAALKIVEENGKLIFPNPEDKEALKAGSDLNVANKILAEIPDSPKIVGEHVHKAIFKERLRKIKEQAYGKIGTFFYQQDANNQVDDLVEYFWVGLPFDGTNYAETRQHLEALMAARKTTRNFSQVTWGSERPKSSIDGQFESAIPESAYPNRRDTEAQKREKVRRLYDNYRAGPAERLSGVDLLKRRGSETGFPSTSHIAAQPFLERLEHLSPEDRKGAKESWNKYIEKLREIANAQNQVIDIEDIPRGSTEHLILGRNEGSLLFEERIVDMVENTTGFEPAKELLQKFFQFVDERLGKARPNPYYAILLADGDRMGELIDRLAQQEQGEEQHRQLSRTLDRLAKTVRSTVRDHKGALVYTGGDDVLAFVPLHRVFQCARKLAQGFQDELQGFKDKIASPPTLSVGIAIVHHLHPLWDALEIARRAEKKAKDVKDKNALAISVNKRSGEDYSVAGKWNTFDEDLEQLITFCREDAIPGGTAYELRDTLIRLNVPGDMALQRAIQADTVRILKRKLSVPRHKQEEKRAKEILDALLRMLDIQLPQVQEHGDEQAAQEDLDQIRQTSERVEQFINKLLVAQVFADAEKLANPSKE